jgi:hypothetical protein
MTKGEFGFHRRGKDETGTAAYVQIYVKSSALGPDLAISAHLMTEAEVDEFMDDGVPTRIKPG